MPFEIEHDGFRRQLRVYASEAWMSERYTTGLPLPIVVLLHDEDLQASAEEIEAVAQLGALVNTDRGQTYSAERGRFVVIVPEGIWTTVGPANDNPVTGPAGSWNSGHRGRDAKALNIRDVEFLERAIDAVRTAFDVRYRLWLATREETTVEAALSSRKVFLVGVGNGAEMAYRASVQLPDVADGNGRRLQVAGVVAVCGSNYGWTDPAPAYDERGPWTPPVTRGGLVLPTPALLAIDGDEDEDFDSAWYLARAPSETKRTEVLFWLAFVGGLPAAVTPETRSGQSSYASWAADTPELVPPMVSSISVLPHGWEYQSQLANGYRAEHYLMTGRGHGWPEVTPNVDLGLWIWDWMVAQL